MYPLRYLPSGHIFIDPRDDCEAVVDAMLETEYNEEFCLASNFGENFIQRLMEAGFLVMSTEIKDYENMENNAIEDEETNNPDPVYILLPKLHLVRSALFFSDIHVKKRVRPLLSMYELRVNTDFDRILDRCVQIHGNDWLTAPLVRAIKNLHRAYGFLGNGSPAPGTAGKGAVLAEVKAGAKARPVSFGVYREGRLKAGEFGVIAGRVYTSYSGYYEEDNAGTVQMILMARWLEKAGFSFLDLGMPLDYKTALGARNISPGQFVELFRSARSG